MSEVIDKPAEAAAPADNPVPAKKREVVLVEPRIGLAEHKRQEWVVEAEEGTMPEDILEPVYWSHVAARFNRLDRIEVRQETGEWICELIVVNAERNWASVHVSAFHDLRKVPTTAPSSSIKHRVIWKGNHKKHCVIRIADAAIIQEGFATAALAQEWMANHERVTAI